MSNRVHGQSDVAVIILAILLAPCVIFTLTFGLSRWLRYRCTRKAPGDAFLGENDDLTPGKWNPVDEKRASTL